MNSSEQTFKASGRRCPIVGCDNGRGAGHAMCRSHWYEVPKPVRDAYFATKPYSDERRAALLNIYRGFSNG